MAEEFGTVIVIDPGGQAAKATALLATEQKRFAEQLRAAHRQIKAQGAQLDALTQKLKKQGGANEDAAKNMDRMVRTQRLVNKVMRETGASAAVAGKVVRAFGKDMDRAEREAVGMARELNVATKETKELTAAQRKAAQTTKAQGKTTVGLTSKLVGLALAYGGVRLAINAISQSAGKLTSLDDALRGTEAVTQATADQMARLEAQARQLGETTPRTATEVATAQKLLARAGFEVEESLSVLPPLIDLVSAGELGLEEATTIVASSLRAFDQDVTETGHILDVLAVASSSANTTIGDLGQGMKFVAPVAAALDIPFEEVASALATLADRGQDATMAGRGIRVSVASLVSPTDKAAAALARMGINLEDVDFKGEGLVDVVELLASKNLTAADAFEIFSVQGATSMLNLTRGVDGFGDLTAKTMFEAEGATKRMAATMEEGVGGMQRRLISAGEAAQISFGKGMEDGLTTSGRAMTAFLNESGAGLEKFGALTGSALSTATTVVVALTDNVDLLTGAFGAFLLLNVPAGIIAIEASVASLTAFLAANPLVAPFIAVGAVVATLNGILKTWSAQSQKSINSVVKESDRLRLSIMGVQAALKSGIRGDQVKQLEKERAKMRDLTVQAVELESKIAAVNVAHQDSIGATARAANEKAALKEQLAEVDRELVSVEINTVKLEHALESTAEATVESANAAAAAAVAAEELAEAQRLEAAAAIQAEKAQKALADALGSLEAKAIKVRSVQAAMDAFGLSAEEARTVVSTLTTIETEAGASALDAANAVADMLGQSDNSAVNAVVTLTDNLEAAKDELKEIAELQDRIASAKEGIISAGLGIGQGRPDGGVFFPGSFDNDPGAGGGDSVIPSRSSPDVQGILRAEDKSAKSFDNFIGSLDIAGSKLEGSAGLFATGVADFAILSKEGGATFGNVAQAFAPLITSLINNQPVQGGTFGLMTSGTTEGGRMAGAIVGTIVSAFAGPAVGQIADALVQGELTAEAQTSTGIFRTSTFGQLETGLSGPSQEALDIISGIIDEVERQFHSVEDLLGIALDTDLAGELDIKLTGDGAVKVVVDGVDFLFATVENAMEFALIKVFQASTLSKSAGKTITAAFEGFKDIGARSRDKEFIEQLFVQARQMDDWLETVTAAGAGIRSLGKETETWVETAIEAGLDVGDVFDFMNDQIKSVLDSITGNVRSMLGVTDPFAAAIAVADDLRSANEALVKAEENRVDRMAEIIADSALLASGGPLRGAILSGNTTATTEAVPEAGRSPIAGFEPTGAGDIGRGGDILGGGLAGRIERAGDIAAGAINSAGGTVAGSMEGAGDTVSGAGGVAGGAIAGTGFDIGATIHEMGESIIGETQILATGLMDISGLLPGSISTQEVLEQLDILQTAFDGGLVNLEEFNSHTDALLVLAGLSADQIKDFNTELQALQDRELPDLLDVDLIRQAFGAATLAAGDSLAQTFDQLKGFHGSERALNALRHQTTIDQLRQELAVRQENLAQSTGLARAAMLEQIADIQRAISGLEAGTIQVAKRGGGGGGRRAEAKREAEEAERAAESFRDSVAALRDELSGATDSQLAYRDAVADLREQAEAGKIGAEELAEALALLAAVDLKAIAEEWKLTGQELQRSDLGAAVKALGEDVRAAKADIEARRGEDPEGADAARKTLRESARLQFRELGKAAIGGFSGPLQRLKKESQATIKEIEFMVNHMDKLGLTAGQIAKTIRGLVVPQLLDMAIAEAERVGDTEKVIELQERKAKMETTFKLAELAFLEQMLIAAGAMTEGLQSLIDDTEEMIRMADGAKAATEGAADAANKSGGGFASSSSTTGFTSSDDLSRLADAIRDFVRSFDDLDAGRFEQQANAWINQVADFNLAVERVLADLTSTESNRLSQISQAATGDADAFSSGDTAVIQGLIDFVNASSGVEFEAWSQALDDLDLLLAESTLEGTRAAAALDLVNQFAAPLEESLSPLEQLNAEYADLLIALDLLEASQETLIDAEQAFADLRMKLLDEQLGGLRGLLGEAEAAILQGRAPREQFLAAKAEFEEASAGADINDAASISRLEAAVQNYKSVASDYGELVGAQGSIMDSVNSAVAAALHLFLDPFAPGATSPSAIEPSVFDTVDPGLVASSTSFSPDAFTPSPGSTSFAAQSSTIQVTVSGLERLTEDFSDFKRETEERWQIEAPVRERTVDALEDLV